VTQNMGGRRNVEHKAQHFWRQATAVRQRVAPWGKKRGEEGITARTRGKTHRPQKATATKGWVGTGRRTAKKLLSVIKRKGGYNKPGEGASRQVVLHRKVPKL